MTDYKKIFIDTAPFIYYIEKNENNPLYYEKLKHFLAMGTKEISLLSLLWLLWRNTLCFHTAFRHSAISRCFIN